MPPRKKKPATGGALNSKTPNAYELAYKELWDKLPEWKKNAFIEDIAAKRYDWSLYVEFIAEVRVLAESREVVAEK